MIPKGKTCWNVTFLMKQKETPPLHQQQQEQQQHYSNKEQQRQSKLNNRTKVNWACAPASAS